MQDEFVSLSDVDLKSKRDQQILHMIDKGLSYAEIGRQIGLTRARVSQIALQYGYVVRPTLVNKENIGTSKKS